MVRRPWHPIKEKNQECCKYELEQRFRILWMDDDNNFGVHIVLINI